MKLYSYLTGPDDASFCRRVTERLNRGRELYGPPTLTYSAGMKRAICHSDDELIVLAVDTSAHV
jgi:hypothetical protein